MSPWSTSRQGRLEVWPLSSLADIVMLDARNRLRNMDGGLGSRESLWLFLKNARGSLTLWIAAYSAFGLFVFLARGRRSASWPLP